MYGGTFARSYSVRRMPPSHPENLEVPRGCDCQVRPVHPENSSEPTSRENLCGDLLVSFLGGGEWISQVLCFAGLARVFKKNPPAIPSKICRRSADKPAEKPAIESDEKIRQKICRKIRLKISRNIRQKIRREIHQIIRHGNMRLPAAVLSPNIAVSLCHLSGLFWMFSWNQPSTFKMQNSQ